MRVLLVDNHDSYTYNVFQLIAQVTGSEPVVVLNDAVAPDALDLAGFDAVVVSPGPGHPGVERDFGLSAAVLERARVPLLGICLGHQGIALAAGAPVVPAPEPRHGHVTRVRHDGSGVFAGLPQGFAAVRYHSLCVAEPLPAPLVATAWAEDGVVMGLRHTGRPFTGVQFHPESVGSERGRDLVGNFLREARPVVRARTPEPPGLPEPPGAAVGTAEPTARSYRLRTRVLERAVDAAAAFEVLARPAEPAFWLDSACPGPGTGRFSFLGGSGGPEAQTVTYRVDGARLTVRDRTGERHLTGRVLDHLAAELAARRLVGGEDPRELPFDLAGGWVGYLGYEVRADCASPTTRRATTPDAAWLFADRFAVLDHEQDRTHLVALVRCDGEGGGDGEAVGAAEADARTWLELTAEQLATLPPARPRPEPAPVPPLPEEVVLPLLDRDREQYLAAVQACRDVLRAGESYEVCLTAQARSDADVDALTAHRRLRGVNPAPYAAFLRLPGVEVACASPERFLRVDRDGWAEAKPIKGTARRGADPLEDERLRASLPADPKTRAENLMIVDLLRNDLGRVCEVGSVSVPELMATETYATAHQLVSTVRGRLRPALGAVDAVRSCFPPGSMTGAPKLRTCEVVDALEERARGVYSGALGYLSLTGAADLAVVIRTLVRAGGRWTAGAGGAVVLDSDPEQELAETLLKAGASLRALLEDPPARPPERSAGWSGLTPAPTPAAAASGPGAAPAARRRGG
ncbi:aminodeoxychorismate synthase component I [Kineococcus sp. G2]|uniref:aminodeoxychorismate synthase component I n=1 Tax=Kineococcus sp. G2 TaxID=3127484 RepID=UPI00301CE42F